MKAKLIRHEKFIIRRRYLIEITVHEVVDAKRYPDKLKWGLVCVDRISSKKVLMDNHHPKGPHTHINDDEFSYEYTGLDDLIKHFREMIAEHMGVKI